MGRLAVLAASPVLLLAACSGEPPVMQAPPSAEPPVTQAPPSAEPSGDAGPAPAYSSSTSRIGPGLRDRMRAGHRAGCPVPLAELRYLRMRYVGFDGTVRTGEMVVHQRYAEDVTEVFRKLFEAGWPIRRMRLVDDYGGDDDRSMAANNTSAYNCRRVAGRDAWSEHAYGGAIDVNPVQNPYVTGSSVVPPAGERFATIDRSAGADVPPGTIRAGDVVVRAFAAIGWEWGGEWSSSKDYQHFSASGR